jgi:SAM-dependent methyltransferase
MTTAVACHLCGSSDTYLFLDRRGVPVHQNLLCRTPDEARAVTRGDLRMTVCRSCEFVFNAAFDRSRMQYGENYDNTQVCSPSFERYVDGLVDRLVNELDIRKKTILEVGCGKGDFLRRVVYADPSNRGVGCDPSYVGELVSADGRLVFERRFYGEGALEVVPDVVICRHVIEHVEKPALLVQSIRGALGPDSRALIFFETPCVEWILRNGVVWDFFYEHCSLFSAASLRALFRRSGFDVTEVRHVFGGQYLWLEAIPGTSDPAPGNASVHELCRDYAARERTYVEQWRDRIEALANRGPVALWGAGAKGVTLANLVDPLCRLLACVVDLNPHKQGCFVAGAGHPIVGVDSLQERGVSAVLLMNANYESEIKGLAAAAGLDLEFVVA